MINHIRLFLIIFFLYFFSEIFIFPQTPIVFVKTKNESKKGKNDGNLKIGFDKSDRSIILTVLKQGKLVTRDTLKTDLYEIKNLSKGKYYIYCYFSDNEDSVYNYKENPVLIK